MDPPTATSATLALNQNHGQTSQLSLSALREAQTPLRHGELEEAIRPNPATPLRLTQSIRTTQ